MYLSATDIGYRPGGYADGPADDDDGRNFLIIVCLALSTRRDQLRRLLDRRRVRARASVVATPERGYHFAQMVVLRLVMQHPARKEKL
jgi:hypothetical protein